MEIGLAGHNQPSVTNQPTNEPAEQTEHSQSINTDHYSTSMAKN